MALVNPNIALAGVPMQVPNFLGMQQTAAATQNTLARTGIMQEEAARESESAEYNTALARSKDALRFVNTPEQYMAWTDASFSDPVLGSQLSRLGLTPDSVKSSALKQFQQPGGFQNVMQMSAANIDQLAGIMGGRASDIAKQQQTAAANARQAAIGARISELMGGGAAPTTMAQPVPPPVNTLATPARGLGANALNAPPMSAAEEIAQTYAAPTAAAPMVAAAPLTATSSNAELETLRAQSVGLRREAALTGDKRFSDAADQIDEIIATVEPAKAGSLSSESQAFDLLKQSGYPGDFRQYKEDFAGFEFKPDANGVLFKINRLTGVASPVEMKGGKPLTPEQEAKAAPSVDDLSTPLAQTNLFKTPQKGDRVTEDERKGAAALQRVLSASDQIAGVTAKNASAAAPGAGEMVAGILPLWDSASSEIQNWARPIDRQIVSAAQRDMIDALLFLATGAAYNKEQLQGQMDSYLPKYTDKSKKVLDAKRTRLIELIQGARARAGGAWTPELDAKVQNLIETSFPDASTSDIPPPPEGADDEFKRLWPKMTPEDRKLWQK